MRVVMGGKGRKGGDAGGAMRPDATLAAMAGSRTGVRQGVRPGSRSDAPAGRPRLSLVGDDASRVPDEAPTPEVAAGGGGGDAPGRRDGLRSALAEAWLPLAAAAAMAGAVLFMVAAQFTSVLLVALAAGVAVILMGTLIYISYEEQRKAREEAERAEAIYAKAMEVRRRASERASRKDDAARRRSR